HLARLAYLRDLTRREERLQLLESLSRRPRKTEESRERSQGNPLFWQQYAQELSRDARQHERAIALLNRALRAHPTDAGSLYILANILWARREFQPALELYRFATCLEDKDEHFAVAY